MSPSYLSHMSASYLSHMPWSTTCLDLVILPLTHVCAYNDKEWQHYTTESCYTHWDTRGVATSRAGGSAHKFGMIDTCMAWFMSHTLRLSHATLIDASSHTHERVMPHTGTRHAAHMNESCRTRGWSCHAYARDMSRISMCHAYIYTFIYIYIHICIYIYMYIYKYIYMYSVWVWGKNSVWVRR